MCDSGHRNKYRCYQDPTNCWVGNGTKRENGRHGDREKVTEVIQGRPEGQQWMWREVARFWRYFKLSKGQN